MRKIVKVNASITPKELQDIETRVDRVCGFLKQATTAWLSVAQEFATAKSALSQLAFERFVNDVEVTKSVADKLVLVGKKKILYDESKLDVIASTESWTVLYELSKLSDKLIDEVIDAAKSANRKRLTREMITNIANNRPTDETVIVLASIEITSTKLKSITKTQSAMIDKKLSEIAKVLAPTRAFVEYKQRDKSVKKVASAAEANTSFDSVEVKQAA